MREIKFRAWDDEVNRMFYDITFESVIAQTMQFEEHWLSITDHVLEQYTGIKDAQGREIYEGDILRHPTILDLGPVEWDEDNASFEWYHPKMYGSGMESAVVIGNIHENKELLD